jgi:hypothetical protein
VKDRNVVTLSGAKRQTNNHDAWDAGLGTSLKLDLLKVRDIELTSFNAGTNKLKFNPESEPVDCTIDI